MRYHAANQALGGAHRLSSHTGGLVCAHAVRRHFPHGSQVGEIATSRRALSRAPKGTPSNAQPHVAASPVSTEDLYRFLVESSTEYAIFAISEDGTVVSWNAGAENVFGYTKAEILGQQFDVIFTPEDRAEGAPRNELQTAETLGRNDSDRWHVRKDGTRFWATNIVQPLRDDHGERAGFTKIVRDATERFHATETLRRSQARFRLLVETVREYAIFAVDLQGHVTLWNAGAGELFGYKAQEIVGKHYGLLYTPEDVQSGVPQMELRRATSHGVCRDERWLVRKDGSRFFSSGRLTQIREADASDVDAGFVKVAHDITERKDMEEAMRHQALHDSLTGLPNRALFLEHLKRAIARSKRHTDTRFAVFFLDVDDFKTVNDSLGHIIADQLLRALATRLHSIVRKEDVFARLGGDEFAILLTDLRHADEAQGLVKRIKRALTVPFEIEGHETFVTMSIGIALDSPHYKEPEQVLRDADMAMYAAKTRGRSNHSLFQPSMHGESWLCRLWKPSYDVASNATSSASCINRSSNSAGRDRSDSKPSCAGSIRRAVCCCHRNFSQPRARPNLSSRSIGGCSVPRAATRACGKRNIHSPSRSRSASTFRQGSSSVMTSLRTSRTCCAIRSSIPPT